MGRNFPTGSAGTSGEFSQFLSEVLRWRRYLDGGGTVAAWQLTHQDGIYPEHSGLPLRGH
jgi:hypothetical protein